MNSSAIDLSAAGSDELELEILALVNRQGFHYILLDEENHVSNYNIRHINQQGDIFQNRHRLLFVDRIYRCCRPPQQVAASLQSHPPLHLIFFEQLS